MEDWFNFINHSNVKNWSVKPSQPDGRDYPLSSIVLEQKELPQKASLDYIVPFVKDQKQCPFCAGFAMTSIGEAYYNYISKMPKNGFSSTFTYWMAKQIDGMPNQDGTTLRAVLKVSHKYGFLPDDLLPFVGNCSKPKITDKMLAEASKYKIKGYARLNGYNEICQAIAAGKFVIVGTIVTDNWSDGYILEPRGKYYGGHATFLSEFNNAMKYTENGIEYEKFLGGYNSWNRIWGFDGQYWMAKYYTEFKYKDLDNIPALFEAWAVEFEKQLKPQINDDNSQPKKEEILMKMATPMQILPPGYAMLHFRSLFKSLDAEVTWGKNEQGKIWAKAIIPPTEKEMIIEVVEDSEEMKIIK